MEGVFIQCQAFGQSGGEGEVQAQIAKPGGIGKEVTRRGIAVYAPLVQDDEAVGAGGFGGQLGDEDRGDAIAGAQAFQQGGYLAAAVWIEQGGGFVQDQVARSHRHHRGNGHALFFAPREMVGRVVPIGLQVEGRQCLFDSPLYFVAGQGQIL